MTRGSKGEQAEWHRAPVLSKSLVALNLTGLVVSVGFSLRGLLGPLTAVPHSTAEDAAAFWSRFAAARTVPLAAAAAVGLLRPPASAGVTAPVLLLLAGAAQASDALIGARLGNRPMTVAPTLMSAIHLVSAVRLSQTGTRTSTWKPEGQCG